jgi:hypothetical protein
VAKHPEEMQRIEITWVRREGPIVMSLGRFELPALMQSERLLEVMRGSCLLCGRVLTCGWMGRKGLCHRRGFFVSAAIADGESCRCRSAAPPTSNKMVNER